MDYVKKFLRQNHDYFNNNQEEIRQQNCIVLKIACLIYLTVLLIYSTITVIVGQSMILTCMYLVYDVIHLLLCIVVFCFPAENRGSKRLNIYIGLFAAALLSFFIIEAVFPFPDQQSIYFPFPIILLVMVFVFRAGQAIGLSLAYVLIYVVLVCLFKTTDVRLNEIFIASGTLISSLAGYVIVSGLRHETSITMGKLRDLSMNDVLTGLYNKRTFEHLCRSFITEHTAARNYAFLFMDVDKFKQINDRFGHQTGDDVLKNIALVMRETFYEKDLLCRFGGDEFVVLMVDVVNEADVKKRVAVFQEKVRELPRFLKTDYLSCSVGIALPAEQPESYDQLLSRADAALYQAKRGTYISSGGLADR